MGRCGRSLYSPTDAMQGSGCPGWGGVVTRSGKSFLCVLNVRIGERREHSLIRMTVLASTSRSVGGRSMPPGQGYGHHDLVTMRSCG